jgi:hypothetical protein
MAVVTIVAAVSTSIAGATLEGRWRLIEQRYESGQADLVRGDSPLHLEFVLDGGKLKGKAWGGSERAGARDWPTVGATEDERQIRIERFEQTVDRVKVHYRVAPVAGDDLYLEITEDYQVTADGQNLAGSATIVFRRGGERKGSYTLHRRFERVP